MSEIAGQMLPILSTVHTYVLGNAVKSLQTIGLQGSEEVEDL